MINEIYIKQAINIRKSYLKIIDDISYYEKMAKEIIDTIQSKLDELNDLQQKINEKKFSSVDSAKNEMTRIVLELESEINTIDKKIKKLNESIDKLKSDEVKLFNEIKNSYPDLSDSEIKDIVQKNVSKLIK